ncbi:hypothetical protein SLE2022_226140 [Rubroshorea leprosula]
MDALTPFFDPQSRTGWSYDKLKNFREIPSVVQTHLKKLYLTLCCALVASAAGAYLHILWNIGGLLTTFGCMGSVVWLSFVPLHQEQKRVALLLASAALQGASVGPLIELAIEIDPGVLVSAFVGTAVASCCFSGASLSMLLWLHVACSIFGGSIALFKMVICFGLLAFVGYIVFDTPDIIEKAHSGDLDYVDHALTLYIDFVAVFIHILVIMLKNSIEKNGDKKKEKRSD